MEEYESLYPMPVSFFSPKAIVLYANDAANLIDEFGRAQGVTSVCPLAYPGREYGQSLI